MLILFIWGGACVYLIYRLFTIDENININNNEPTEFENLFEESQNQSEGCYQIVMNIINGIDNLEQEDQFKDDFQIYKTKWNKVLIELQNYFQEKHEKIKELKEKQPYIYGKQVINELKTITPHIQKNMVLKELLNNHQFDDYDIISDFE